LATLFSQRGYPLIGDDVAVAELVQDNTVILRAGAPRIRLLPDALETFGGALPADLRERNIDRKHEIPIPTHDGERSVVLDRIYFIEFDETTDSMPTIEPMGKFEAVVALRRNVYRDSLISRLGKERTFLEWATRALTTIACYRLRRPRALHRLGEVGDLLEGHWSGAG
jgi:hypothetical protein